MTTLRDGTATADPRLDRLRSVRTDHLEKYPLTAATLPSAATPISMGINWYSAFDTPRLVDVPGYGQRWVIGDGSLGSVRGGHATALRPWDTKDALGWWGYYNQGVEGRCVEFSVLRVLSLLNRKRYDITSRWHYHEMQRIDEWAGGSYPGATPFYEGTSVRAGLEIVRKYGAIPKPLFGRKIDDPASKVRPSEGIAVYRWALNWQDVRTVLGVPDGLPGVPMLNSWGKGYPREVLLADAAGERVLREDGEFGVVTDR